jgi:hypothetical protein
LYYIDFQKISEIWKEFEKRKRWALYPLSSSNCLETEAILRKGMKYRTGKNENKELISI